ncbi:hypothetical protein [Phage f2b1]|nr:hypothetical protein [Phage f2b1]
MKLIGEILKHIDNSKPVEENILMLMKHLADNYYLVGVDAHGIEVEVTSQDEFHEEFMPDLSEQLSFHIRGEAQLPLNPDRQWREVSFRTALSIWSSKIDNVKCEVETNSTLFPKYIAHFRKGDESVNITHEMATKGKWYAEVIPAEEHEEGC